MTSKKSAAPRAKSISAIAGASDGPFVVSEELPTDQKEMERRIAGKFLAALLEHSGRRLEILRAGDEWPDFEATEVGERVGIELAVVTLEAAEKRQHDREAYAHAVLERLQANSLTEMLPGVTIHIADPVERYPRIREQAGRALIDDMADAVRTHTILIARSPHGEPRTWDLIGLRSQTMITMTVVRRSLPAAMEPFELKVGVGSVETGGSANRRLSRTIEAKLSKSYAPYSAGKLILLTYSFNRNDATPAALNRAREVLASQRHPFDQVWYLVPTFEALQHPEFGAHTPLSDLVQVWPVQASEDDTTADDSAQDSDEWIGYHITASDLIPVRPAHFVRMQGSSDRDHVSAVRYPVTPDQDTVPCEVEILLGHEEVSISFHPERRASDFAPRVTSHPLDIRVDALLWEINRLRLILREAFFDN